MEKNDTIGSIDSLNSRELHLEFEKKICGGKRENIPSDDSAIYALHWCSLAEMCKIFLQANSVEFLNYEEIDNNIEYVILQMFQETGTVDKNEVRYDAYKVNDLFENNFKKVLIENKVKGKKLKIVKRILKQSKKSYVDKNFKVKKEYDVEHTEKWQEADHRRALAELICQCHGMDYKVYKEREMVLGSKDKGPKDNIICASEILPFFLLFTVYYHGYYCRAENKDLPQDTDRRDEFSRQITRRRKNKTECVCYEGLIWIIGCIYELINLNSDILKKMGLEVTCGGLSSFLQTFSFFDTQVRMLNESELIEQYESEKLIPYGITLSKMGTVLIQIILDVDYQYKREKKRQYDCRITKGIVKTKDKELIKEAKDFYEEQGKEFNTSDCYGLSSDFRILASHIIDRLFQMGINEINNYLNDSGKEENVNIKDNGIGLVIKNRFMTVFFDFMTKNQLSYISTFMWIVSCIELIKSPIWTEEYKVQSDCSLSDDAELIKQKIFKLKDLEEYIVKEFSNINEKIREEFENLYQDKESIDFDWILLKSFLDMEVE